VEAFFKKNFYHWEIRQSLPVSKLALKLLIRYSREFYPSCMFGEDTVKFWKSRKWYEIGLGWLVVSMDH